jgi:beta-glucanase (GH16 family)
LFATVLLLGGWPQFVHAAPPEGQDWVSTFEAAFDGSLDAATWVSASGSSDAFESARGPANVVVENGAARLVVGHSDRGGWQWISGQIESRSFRQTYGYFEARLRYAGATGLNNGFRLVTDAPLAEGGVVVDVDQGHYPSEIVTALRRDGEALAQKTTVPAADLSREFHLYGLAWLPNDHGSTTLRWYFDGRLVRTLDCAACTQPVRIVLGAAVTSNAKVAGPATPALDGKSMDIAAVRAYRVKEPASVANAIP